MYKRFVAWFVAVMILVQNLLVCSPAQAAPNPFVSSAAIALTSPENNVVNLNFSDTEEFYKQLTEAIRSKQTVNLSTPFKSYDEFPKRLQKLFPLKKSNISGTAVEVGAGLAAAGIGSAIASLNVGALVSLSGLSAAGVAAGAGAGVFFGGIGAVPLALAGGAIGFASGAILVAVMRHDVAVTVEIKPFRGSIMIYIKPALAA